MRAREFIAEQADLPPETKEPMKNTFGYCSLELPLGLIAKAGSTVTFRPERDFEDIYEGVKMVKGYVL